MVIFFSPPPPISEDVCMGEDDCCSAEKPCDLYEGDCDWDHDCRCERHVVRGCPTNIASVHVVTGCSNARAGVKITLNA